MMQMCGRVSSNSGGNEGDVYAGIHGGLDARQDAALIRPTNETCPTEAAREGGGRGRHRDALEHALSKADDSPQPARMAGEASADRHRAAPGRPGGKGGTLAIVFRPLRRCRRRAGVLTDSSSPQAAFSGLGTSTGYMTRQRRAHGRLSAAWEKD